MASEERPPLREVAHCAHRLSCSQEHVRRLIRRGELAAVHLNNRWRVEAAELEAFIDRQRTPAARLSYRGAGA